MTMSVDTLMSNLQMAVDSFSANANALTSAARTVADGTSGTLRVGEIDYVSNPYRGIVNSKDAYDFADEFLAGFWDQLKEFYCLYFPTVGRDYLDWLAELSLVVRGDKSIVHPDNELHNRLQYQLDSLEAAREKASMRASWSARGFMSPPGGLFKSIYDARDTRSEALVMKSIAEADRSSNEVISAFTKAIQTGLKTIDSRTEAINAISDYIKGIMSAYDQNIDYIHAHYARATAITEKTLAYYKAELEMDRLNSRIYAINSDHLSKQYNINTDAFWKVEGMQVDASNAAAERAGDIAKAAYSALNTVASSSTVGFG